MSAHQPCKKRAHAKGVCQGHRQWRPHGSAAIRKKICTTSKKSFRNAQKSNIFVLRLKRWLRGDGSSLSQATKICTNLKKSFSKGKKSNIFKVTSNRRRERDGRFFKVPLVTGRTGADGIVSQRHFQSASAR